MSKKEITALANKIENLDAEGDDDHDEGISFPKSVLKRIIGLKAVQTEYDTLEEDYKKQRAALEHNFAKLRAPLFAKRNDIVNGVVEVDVELPADTETEVEDDPTIKGIPNFWLQAMRNHSMLGSMITEDDAKALESLTDVTIAHNEEMSQFTLTFTFAANEYFSNTELTKSYSVYPDLLSDKAPELNEIKGTEIQWLPKKNLCMTETRKKQKGKGKKAGQVKFVTQVAPRPSFFHYFADPKTHNEEEDEEEIDDEEEGGDFKLSVDEDYEVGHTFRAEIIPEAILWFTGEAAEDDDFFMGDDEDNEEGEDEEGDDEEDDDPAGESEVVPTSGFGAPAAGAAGAAQPECKQS